MKVRELFAWIGDPKYANFDVKVMDVDSGYDLLAVNIQFDEDNQQIIFTDGKDTP